jgi:23S rRNA pseudouridine2457 synthase
MNASSRLILFHKPFQVLCQFSPEGEKQTLALYLHQKEVYPAGRLDYDSEGLLLLTDDGRLQHRITDPRHKWPKTYWAQVEGVPTETQLQQLRSGVELKDGRTLPAEARLIDLPGIWERVPPIRVRKQVPDAWIELCIREGKNRQVRRMTAAVGLPTLRLIRAKIGPYALLPLEPGQWRELRVGPDGEALR